MKKLIYFLLITLAIPSISNGQEINEYYFKFKIESKSEIEKITQLISIDNVKDNVVYAYANNEELATFKKLGYTIEFIQKEVPKSIIMADSIHEMANWNRYPTYEVYQQLLKRFETNYPQICKLDSIGTTVNGRKLYVVKISDNVTIDETEPEFFYTSTIHGDEATGYILMLRFIDSLLTSYGTNPEIDKLVNSMEIFINPNANPDGTYRGGNSTVTSATRSNANNKDLNRDFPDPRIGLNTPYQPETQAMMDYAATKHFVMSANFHGGAEVMNYPWDTWTTSQNPHADANWFNRICTDYVTSARKVKSNYMTDTYSSGVTEGGDWYVITGGRQDYMNYWHHCREVTIEISSVKLLAVENLDYYWRINRQSLFNYLKECGYGFHGTIKNSTGDPLKGVISIENHDQLNDSSIVYSDPTVGDFHRPIETGTFTVNCSVNGYTPRKVKNIPVSLNSTIWLDFVLDDISMIAIPNVFSDTIYTNKIEHALVLHNTGIEVNNYTVAIENPEENNWLTINKTNGVINLESSDTLLITISKGVLQPGIYQTNIIVSETDGNLYTIPVSLNIPDISLEINPESIIDTLEFQETSTHKISLFNSGTLLNNYNVTIENQNENTWISCNKYNGSIYSSATDTVIVTITNNYLLSGNYSTNIIITEGDNDIHSIPVTINIPIYPDTSLIVNTETIYDSLYIGESSEKKIVIYNSGNVQNTYNVTLDYSEGTNWMTTNKSTDTIQSQETDTLMVYLNTQELNAGDYSCTINITEQDNDVHYINVYLNVQIADNITIRDNNKQIKVFPNPFNDNLNIELNIDYSDEAFVQLYTITGELIKQLSISYASKNDRYIKIGSLQHLNSGTYILKIIDNNNVFSIPLIKN